MNQMESTNEHDIYFTQKKTKAIGLLCFMQ